MPHYSPSHRGFYDADTGVPLPVDAVFIDARERDALIAAQAAGKRIDWTNGRPVAAEPVAPARNVQAEIDVLERESLTNRGARELHLQLMRQQGAEMGLQTDDAIAAKVPYFRKLKALDDQIRVLRALL
jgi:hypothetical protein